MDRDIEQSHQEISIAQQLHGIAKAPIDFDYKSEIANRYSNDNWQIFIETTIGRQFKADVVVVK